MKPPSVQLLRTLRHANIPRCYSSAVRTLICPYQDRSTSRTLRAAAKNPATHINAARTFITVPPRHASPVPRTVDRGPPSKEDTQTDFGTMNVLGNTPAPTTAIDACLDDGFHLDNGLKIIGGCGCILVSGEAFSWRPWEAGGRAEGAQKGRMINKKGQWDVEKEAWGVLDLMWPKPDLLILGLGPCIYPISPETRKHINSLGIRVDIQDTRNAAAQFNLLATERGVGNIAAALIPIGWKEPR
ncbi:MAG: hypothetical protein FRX48_00504 [Lasallia pustulata]|uniref:NADH dehydrogenase [ubiquinone] 1 alpha subcomplex assembly factor 3 n=1 Tax=Lasallia pustulata TaxID=136370 RepID=A0A5M8Q0V9_9LECA|nr:MAG: hypothetical protein FRX48_00504 [Lasallia pustulata]